MKFGIDASNISSGGGLTHLIELLSSIPDNFLIENTIYVWGSSKTLSHIPKRKGIFLETKKLLDKNLLYRLFWQIMILSKIAKKCDILFIPGSLFLGNFRPYVTMFRNLLPFDKKARKKFKFSAAGLRYYLLAKGQFKTFKKSDGLIFLSNNSKEFIVKNYSIKKPLLTVISHGISQDFFMLPRPQKPLASYTINNKLKLTYVSTINYYKNQINVIYAVKSLIDKGYPIQLEFAGGAYKKALYEFQKVLKQIDSEEKNMKYIGPVLYKKLPQLYHQTDILIFASSCETFGQILLEAMASGLPIACSNKSVMPEILGDAGLYFNPENEIEIANAIEKLIINQKLREELAYKAYMKAKEFSWRKCADETFSFLIEVAKEYPKEK